MKNLESEIRKSVRNSLGRKSDISPSSLKDVERLSVRNKTIPSPSPIVWLTRAKHIEIKDCKFSDFKSLGKELSGLPSMNFCFLENCQISDAAPLAGLARLRKLDLRGNPKLTRAEVDKLQKALPKCEISDDLRPASVRVEMKIEIAIRQSSNKPTGELTPADRRSLKELRLGNYGITDLKPLAGLTGLEWLSLSNNQITYDEVNKLKKALPKCHILR